MGNEDIFTEFPGSQEPPPPKEPKKVKPLTRAQQMAAMQADADAMRQVTLNKQIPPRSRLVRSSAELPQT